MDSNLVIIELGQKNPNWEETVCPRLTNRQRETSHHPKNECSGHLLFSPAQTPSFLLVIACWFYLVACARAWHVTSAELVKCPLPGIWIFNWKRKELIHPDSSAPKNFPFVFVPWSSPQPSGWSFLRPVDLTFLQLLCAAPCHSSKFLFYHWVSLHNFCCLPPKNPGRDSGIQTAVWPAEMVGQQPSTPVKESLILTCEERVPLRSNNQVNKCAWMNFC